MRLLDEIKINITKLLCGIYYTYKGCFIIGIAYFSVFLAESFLTTFLYLALLSKLCNCHSFSARSPEFKQTSPNPQIPIESNSIQRLIVKAHDENDSSRLLKRVFLSNRSVICNDGSQAGFYFKKSYSSKRWVVFLEGGWHCYDAKSCRTRWLKHRHLMTSSQWPETRFVGGILSSTPDDNPYWYDTNHVLIPYCSSDSWSGTRIKADSRDGWHFMGSLIIRQVIKDLIPLGLGRQPGSELLLVGSSAGGLGVMLNLDRISNYIRKEKKLKVLVRGISDSGWFLDREPYTPGAVAASETVREGWKMWEGSVPEACVKQHLTEPWRCYFGHRLYSTLKSSLFVFQWLFDEAQIRADSVGAPVTPQQWNYIHDMGRALRMSLDNVTAVFAPSCIGHAVLTKSDWLHIKIDDISLADALRSWEKETGRRKNGLKPLLANKKSEKRRKYIDDLNSSGEKTRYNSNDYENCKHIHRAQKVEVRCQYRERKKNHKRSNVTDTNVQNDVKLRSSLKNLTDVERFYRKKKMNLALSVKMKSNINNSKRRKPGQMRHQQQHHHQRDQKNQGCWKDAVGRNAIIHAQL